MSNGNTSSNSYSAANQKVSNSTIQSTTQHSSIQDDPINILSPSYSNQHQNHYASSSDSPQYAKDCSEQVHISVYNSPQHYQQHQRLSSNSGISVLPEKVTQGKYVSYVVNFCFK